MGLTYNYETMKEALDYFGEDYSYPVYATLNDVSSFFASNMNVKPGYAAVSENNVLLVLVDLLGNADHRRLPILGINKVKASKGMLIPNYNITFGGQVDGKKYSFKLIVPSKILGGASNFPDQQANSHGFFEKLKSFNNS